MKQEVKALLKPIVKALNKEDEVSRDLWAILTALRGPDSNRYKSGTSLKSMTTARLRFAIGLRCGAYAQIKAGQQSTPAMIRTKYPDVSFHFLSHYEEAVKALKRR